MKKEIRDKQLNVRLSEKELDLIDALRDKVNLTKKSWNKISRIDAIVMAITYATGGMFPETDK